MSGRQSEHRRRRSVAAPGRSVHLRRRSDAVRQERCGHRRLSVKVRHAARRHRHVVVAEPMFGWVEAGGGLELVLYEKYNNNEWQKSRIAFQKYLKNQE